MPANAKNLELKWMYQAAVAGAWQTTPLVVDGVMYLTQRPNDVVALDALSGRVFWIYKHTLDPTLIVCCGANNRGLAILGDTLFMGTLDAHLVAIDARSGRALWNTKVAPTARAATRLRTRRWSSRTRSSSASAAVSTGFAVLLPRTMCVPAVRRGGSTPFRHRMSPAAIRGRRVRRPQHPQPASVILTPGNTAAARSG